MTHHSSQTTKCWKDFHGTIMDSPFYEIPKSLPHMQTSYKNLIYIFNYLCKDGLP